MPQPVISYGTTSNAPANKQVPEASWLGFAGCDAVTVTAMCLTVGGWALIWARGLSIIELVPLPLAVTPFFLGLLLIPFRPAR